MFNGLGIKEGYFPLSYEMDMWHGEVIISNKESRSEGNLIVEILLCDLRFDIWIRGSWPSLQGLIVIDSVDRAKKRIMKEGNNSKLLVWVVSSSSS